MQREESGSLATRGLASGGETLEHKQPQPLQQGVAGSGAVWEGGGGGSAPQRQGAWPQAATPVITKASFSASSDSGVDLGSSLTASPAVLGKAREVVTGNGGWSCGTE